jgi:hypothetical protein
MALDEETMVQSQIERPACGFATGAYTQVVERGMVFEAMLTVQSADECNGKLGCKFDVDS